MSPVVARSAYLKLRSLVRALVTRHPRIDLALGRALVKIDLAARRIGLVDVLGGTSTFDYDGLHFEFDAANRDIGGTVLTNGDYEPATTAAILRTLRFGGSFVDLGANIGFFTLLAARAVGAAGRVYAFEPAPRTLAVLRRNLAINGLLPRVTVEECAISDFEGTTRFLVMPASQGSSVAAAGDTSGQPVEVRVTTLDKYFATAGWPPVELLKMDIEGQELKAFRGMRELIRRNAGITVVFEYHLEQIQRFGHSGRDLIQAARDTGLDRFMLLFRRSELISLPQEMARLDAVATRANVNLMATVAAEPAEPGGSLG